MGIRFVLHDHGAVIKGVFQKFAQVAFWPLETKVSFDFFAKQFHRIGAGGIKLKYFFDDAGIVFIHNYIGIIEMV